MFASLRILRTRAYKTLTVGDVSRVTLERRRMYVLFAIALLKLLNFLGGDWDIQWHVFVGRDSLFIPPHLMVMVAFAGGIALAWFWICVETFIIRAEPQTGDAVRLGPLQAPLAFWGVFLGYAGALLSGVFDEWWHRTYGIDATLWSPPHLCVMASTMTVDYSLMVGIYTSARRLGSRLEWHSPLFWGLGLTGAYLFEAVNFQMSQAFLEAYRVNGTGVTGILFPVLVGALFPMPMLLTIKLARRFSVVALVFGMAMLLQLIGTGVAAAGFAILQPVSQIDEFARLYPGSGFVKAGEFISQIGFSGWVGIQQAWSLALSALPLVLVSLLDLSSRARRRPLVAAPIYSISLVLASLVWMTQMPLMRDYVVALPDVFLGVAVSVCIGLVAGRIGLHLGRVVTERQSTDEPEGLTTTGECDIIEL